MHFTTIKKGLAVTVFSVTFLLSFSQNAADLRKSGDYYFAEGNYFSAAYYYRQLLESGPQKEKKSFFPGSVSLLKAGGKKAAATADPFLLHRLAESYRLSNDYHNAGKYYGQLVEAYSDRFPDAAFWYGVSLRVNGKYAEAKTALQQYLQRNNDGLLRAKAERELQNLAFIQQQEAQKEKSRISVRKLDDGINTPETNYAGVWTAGGLLFTSTREDAPQKNDAHTNNLYVSDENGKVQKLALPFDADLQKGAAAVSRDGSRLYLTAWRLEHGQNVSAIYTSKKENGSWSEPVRLNENINATGSSLKQPFVTGDEKYLLFSSDRAGGQGGFDLWAAPINADGEPGTAFNLGTAINTAEDDEAPFYHLPTQTLVFASNGRVGMGGFDLYQSKGTIGGNWTEAVNMGSPINSSKDDSYFSTSSTTHLLDKAVISSDRYSDYCLALFGVNKNYNKLVVGRVIDCSTSQVLAGADVQFDNLSTILRTNSDGQYQVEIKDTKPFSVLASKDGFEKTAIQVATGSESEADTIVNKDICLTAINKVPEASSPKAVYFDFAKYGLRPEAKLTLDTLVSLLQKDAGLQLLITGYTDGFGTENYNIKLAQQRADACRDYLVALSVDAGRVQTDAKGECCPVVQEKMDDWKDNEAARQVNRRVEFRLSSKQ